MSLMFINNEMPNTSIRVRRLLIWLTFVAGTLFLVQPSVGLAEDDRSSSITGPWFEDPLKSDNLHRFLSKNLQYIDVSAIRFRGTRRGVIVGGQYRRQLSDKQITKILNYL